MSRKWVVVVHGGAGAMRAMGADKERRYREGILKAVDAGARELRGGGDAVRAVVAAVADMERGAVFNAGHGSCLTSAGEIETDAGVMSGLDLSIGGVAAVPGLGNAVSLAERIRSASPHCLFAGPAALQWGEGNPDWTLESARPTPERLAKFHAESESRTSAPQRAEDLTALGGTHDEGDTVGALALDEEGHLAVAVSTGGIWLKTPGRVGDSPLPSSGFWAEDGVVACCATGTGEFIMRAALCAEVRARHHGGQPLQEAAAGALDALTARFGRGRAGLIAIDAQGHFATPFHTAGMGRGWQTSEMQKAIVRIWPEEDP